MALARTSTGPHRSPAEAMPKARPSVSHSSQFPQTKMPFQRNYMPSRHELGPSQALCRGRCERRARIRHRQPPVRRDLEPRKPVITAIPAESQPVAPTVCPCRHFETGGKTRRRPIHHRTQCLVELPGSGFALLSSGDRLFRPAMHRALHGPKPGARPARRDRQSAPPTASRRPAYDPNSASSTQEIRAPVHTIYGIHTLVCARKGML